MRCRQTADILADGLPGRPRVQPLDALAPGGGHAAVIAEAARVAKRPARRARRTRAGHRPSRGQAPRHAPRDRVPQGRRLPHRRRRAASPAVRAGFRGLPHRACSAAWRPDVAAALVRVSVVINPVAGVRGGSLNRARRRAEQAFDLLTAEGAEPEILITERHGHARELAHGAVERGVAPGDCVGRRRHGQRSRRRRWRSPAPSLGDHPGGSGNGLARMLGDAADPKRGAAATGQRPRSAIDVGDIERAAVRQRGRRRIRRARRRAFRRLGRARRGFLRYAAIVSPSSARIVPQAYTLELDADAAGSRLAPSCCRFANGRQWGNGASSRRRHGSMTGCWTRSSFGRQSRAACPEVRAEPLSPAPWSASRA